MRTLLEAVALNVLLRSDARRSREDFLDIALSLPFQTDTNTGMGILFKCWGDTLCHMAGGVDVVTRAASGGGGTEEERVQVRGAKAQTMEMLDGAFPNVKSVSSELQRGFRFWQLVRFSPSFPSSPLPFFLGVVVPVLGGKLTVWERVRIDHARGQVAQVVPGRRWSDPA